MAAHLVERAGAVAGLVEVEAESGDSRSSPGFRACLPINGPGCFLHPPDPLLSTACQNENGCTTSR